jgi:hypothetical protein
MTNLTPEGLRIADEVAQRHGMSRGAVVGLLRALADGGGYQAQFNHPDLGGMGQWSQGGMTMVGDMFNNGLKHRVDMLCSELARLVQEQGPAFAQPAQSQSQNQGGAGVSLFVRGPGSSSLWWPAELGAPASTGAQNDMRYACFPSVRRLAIQLGGQVRVYDTGEHVINGFSQQQSGDQSLTFTSQFGLVRVDDLPLVFPHAAAHEVAPSPPPTSHVPEPEPVSAAATPVAAAPSAAPGAPTDILATIERLAEMRQKGIVTDEEFAAKKAELLRRL